MSTTARGFDHAGPESPLSRVPLAPSPHPAHDGLRAPDAPASALPAAMGATASITLPDTAEYARLLARLKGGDTGIDFRRLRLAYAATSAYQPYDVDTELRNAMFEALGKGEHARARTLADSALSKNYLDIFAHIAAAASARELMDNTAADFHRTLAQGLLASIGRGDNSKDAPFLVISVDEEYAFLQTMGLERTTQGLSTCAGHPCDQLTVRDSQNGKTSVLYFDVTIPFGSFSRQLERGSTAPPAGRRR
jgi:hypothetical protein